MKQIIALATLSLLMAGSAMAADAPAKQKVMRTKPPVTKTQPQAETGTTACPGINPDSQEAADCLMRQELTRLDAQGSQASK